MAVLTGQAGVGWPDSSIEFLQPPLHRSMLESTWGTFYTAAYSPAWDHVALWPDDEWHLSVFGDHSNAGPVPFEHWCPNPVSCVASCRTTAGCRSSSRTLRDSHAYRTSAEVVEFAHAKGRGRVPEVLGPSGAVPSALLK